MVGRVTDLQQEPRGEVIRISWVGVQGATAYRVLWKQSNGEQTFVCVLFFECSLVSCMKMWSMPNRVVVS